MNVNVMWKSGGSEKFMLLPAIRASMVAHNYNDKEYDVYHLRIEGHYVEDTPEFWGKMLIIGVPKDGYEKIPYADQLKLGIF